MGSLGRWRIPAAVPGDSVEGAQDSHAASVEDMGIEHRSADTCVAEELLDGSNVVAVLQEVGGKGVPHGLTGGSFVDARGGDGSFHNPLDG